MSSLSSLIAEIMCSSEGNLHSKNKPMANASSLSENLDQELSLEELDAANGGIVWWLVGAMLLIPLTANSPSEKKDREVLAPRRGK